MTGIREEREECGRSHFGRKSWSSVLGRLSFPCLVDLHLAVRYISLESRVKVGNANVGGINISLVLVSKAMSLERG